MDRRLPKRTKAEGKSREVLFKFCKGLEWYSARKYPWSYLVYYIYTGMFPVGNTSCRTLMPVCLSVCLSVCVCVCPPTYR